MITDQALSCATTIDYAQVQADRVLPFSFTLDSVTALPGGLQRFCYTVRGHGAGGSAEADLSHFLLVSCEALTLSDIVSAEVTIDGQPAVVILGENVTVMTAENPDPTTGCPGIKFDFGLNKVLGVMTVCFTLARAFGVEAVPVCVKGGLVTLSSLSICGPGCEAPACDSTVYQRASVSVPITISPYAVVGEITTRCCGASTITQGAAANTFVVTQELCMSVPIAFGANAEAGQAVSTVIGTSTTDLCADCGATAAAARCSCP